MRRPVGIAVAVISIALLAAPAAVAARSRFFGISQRQINADGQLDVQDLNGMAAEGVGTSRFELDWRSVVPTQGSFDWTGTDRFIGALAARGIQALPFVWGSPPWVTSNPGSPPIDSAAHERSWTNFLKAAVHRYGPNGSYWGSPYHARYGAGAVPLPVHSWQVWNEPNLNKYFDPVGTDSQRVQAYGQLLRISHDAIKSRDPSAEIVLAGNPGYPLRGLKAWEFLDRLYQFPGIKSDFDVAALHPYAAEVWNFGQEIRNMRDVMKSHDDAATPLWLTEFGWGSAPPDRFGINQGPAGQAQRLHDAFNLVLENRSDWNVQRLYWFLWRDPAPDSPFAHRCGFCGSAGLLHHDRSPKLAYKAFTNFSADTTPPRASITSGPPAGGFTRNPTPAFSLASNERGSTFRCRLDRAPRRACASPYSAPPLSDGRHTFHLRAIDAPGNVSRAVSRSFIVDTHAPPAPRITDTDPDSPANNNRPMIKGSSIPGPRVRLYEGASCSGSPVASGSAAQFSSPGLAVAVADNTTTTLHATATDAAGNVSGCSAGLTYVEQTP